MSTNDDLFVNNPRPPVPPKPPVNPWRVVGWLVVVFLVLILIGAYIQSHHGQQCPDGYVWVPAYQTCVAQ